MRSSSCSGASQLPRLGPAPKSESVMGSGTGDVPAVAIVKLSISRTMMGAAAIIAVRMMRLHWWSEVRLTVPASACF